MSKVCLIFIFNHRYDANIPKIKNLYGHKFSNIKFLVPFYNGNEENVISVFESSYQFHGYLIQGLRDIYDENVEHYIFIADDMLLNPLFDEDNIIEAFSMNGKSAFITSIDPLNSEYMFTEWNHAKHAARPFTRPDTNYRENLLSYEDALSKMRNYFGDYSEYYNDEFFQNKENKTIDLESKEKFIRDNGGSNKINYPLARGYSDFFILDKSVIKNVAYTCGIFSAMNLFVEIALPTSIILNCDAIVTIKETKFVTKLMWTQKEVDEFSANNNYDLQQLIMNMNHEIAIYHPIKLSKWKM